MRWKWAVTHLYNNGARYALMADWDSLPEIRQQGIDATYFRLVGSEPHKKPRRAYYAEGLTRAQAKKVYDEGLDKIDTDKVRYDVARGLYPAAPNPGTDPFNLS